jgi:RNA polymerase sigma-70 factor, ECF subfamily
MAEDARSDQLLIERIAAGDERALSDAYDRFSTIVYSIARHILDDDADAEDVTAEVFLQIWQSASRFDATRANAAAWVAVIARSRALDRVRARKRRTRLAQSIVQTAPAAQSVTLPDKAAEQDDLRAKVKGSLAALPPEQRQALELALYGGLTHSEIAEALDQPLGTIKTRIRSAMSKLRDVLEAYT